jgi:hypothetical protein
MEEHLEPLAIAANITQATNCRLDTVLLTFGYLVIRYQAMASRNAEDPVEPEVCARQRVNRLHRFVREPMPESAE